jgi:ankyrin repeat protein
MNLIEAVKSNNINRVEILLKQGVDPNGIDKKIYPPFHWACIWGYIKIAKLLVNAGVDLNLKFRISGKTPLELAGYYKQNEMVKWLLKNGANPNVNKNSIPKIHKYNLSYDEMLKQVLKYTGNHYSPSTLSLIIDVFIYNNCKYSHETLFSILTIVFYYLENETEARKYLLSKLRVKIQN